MFLKYEFGAAEKIGFGLNVAYAGAGITYDDGTGTARASLDWWDISYNARGNRYFGINAKF